MTLAILVPIKDPLRAKSRLAPLFGRRERETLASAMLDDLAAALVALQPQVPVVAVTRAGSAAARVAAFGWRVITEASQVRESVSVDAASRRLAAEGVRTVLRLPADLPLIESEDVQELLVAAPAGRGAVLVPSRDGTGTNALLRRPPDLFPSRFGPGSLALHLDEGRRAGVPVRVVENPRLALDLDEPGDVDELLRRGARGATLRALRTLGMLDGVARHDR